MEERAVREANEHFDQLMAEERSITLEELNDQIRTHFEHGNEKERRVFN